MVIAFPGTPTLGTAGKIRIYDAADNRLVDMLDLSIPPGPTAGGARAGTVPYTPVAYEYVPGHFTNANTAAGSPVRRWAVY
jgi:pectinesterase